MNILTQLSAWVKQNFGWIKTVAIVLLVGFLILSITNAGCVRKQRDKFVAETTVLHILNDSLKENNRILQGSIDRMDTERIELNNHIKILQNSFDSLVREDKKIREDLLRIPEEIRKLSADSLYKFLNIIAYPFKGIQDYPFNEPQIEKIGEDYLENIKLQALVILLDKELINSGFRFATGDSLVITYKNSMSFIIQQNRNLEKTVSNKDKEIDLYKKQKRQDNNGKTLWQVTTAIATALALLFAL